MLVKRRVASVPPTWAAFAGESNACIMTLHVEASATRQAGDALQGDVPYAPRDAQLTVQTDTACAVQLARCQMNANAEELLAADVNGAGIVACLVRPTLFYRQLQSIAEPAGGDAVSCAVPDRRVLFFAGRQRLADCPWTTLSVADEKTSPAEPSARPALRCLRLPSGASAAVCAVRPDVLWLTSTARGASHGEHVLTFAAGTHVECTGAGRGDLAEVTVVLSDRSVVLYGVRESRETVSPRSRTQGGQARADRTTATSTTSPSEASSGSGGWVVWESETRSQPCVHTTEGGSETRTSCALVELVKVALPDVGAPVRRACWSGRRTLWLVHGNGTVLVLRDRNTPAVVHDDSSGGDDTCVPQLQLVQSVTLPQWVSSGAATDALWLCANASQAVVHYAVQDTTMNEVLYGALRLTGSAQQPEVRVVLCRTALTATVYGLRVSGSCRRYQLLTQGVQGRSALYITTVPCDSAYMPGTSNAADNRVLCRDIAAATSEVQLFDCCRRCEAALAALDTRRAAETGTAQALAHLRELHDAARALLHRELRSADDTADQAELTGCEGADGGDDGSNSYPRRLLRRVAERRRELMAYAVLSAVHALDDIDAPLTEMLHLAQARAARQRAGSAVTSLMQQTFPALVPEDGSADTEDGAALRGRLCVDHILAALGVPGGAASTSLRELITRWPAPSRVMALLVLYCSHRDCLADAMTTTTAGQTRRQTRDALREAFLRDCNEPVSLNAWAFVAFAVDHGIDPTATTDATSRASEAAEDEEGGGVPAASALHRGLGMLAHHLDDPPLCALLPSLLTGLIAAGGFDAALHSLCTMLPWLSQPEVAQALAAGSAATPPCVMPWGPLLYLALQARAEDMVRTLLVLALDTQDGVLHELATRALAYVALQRGDASSLRGLVQVGSSEALLVEKVLSVGGAQVEGAHRERVLLQYYILTRRFATALQLCEAMSAKGGAAVEQRLQSVATCLRSLTATTRSVDETDARAGDAGDVDAAAFDGDTLRATPLELSDATLEAAAGATIARLQARSDSAAARSTLQSCHTAGPSHTAVLRPSSVPLSLLPLPPSVGDTHGQTEASKET